jgi:FdhD protein
MRVLGFCVLGFCVLGFCVLGFCLGFFPGFGCDEMRCLYPASYTGPVKSSIISLPIRRLSTERVEQNAQDLVAVEEPLAIKIRKGGEVRDIAITMRTPGHDGELAAGFLFSEGILESASVITQVDTSQIGEVTVCVKDGVTVNVPERNFYVTSSCGVCGKASVEALRETGCVAPLRGVPKVSFEVISSLPEKLRQAQAVFEHTGGLHAAGLFDVGGNLLAVREDVGRHNALDKLIGGNFLANRLPMQEAILMLSGRVSFELVQKAVRAGIPIVAAVGAPSSLAVETGLQFGLTLAGFVRDGRANVYCGGERLLS